MQSFVLCKLRLWCSKQLYVYTNCGWRRNRNGRVSLAGKCLLISLRTEAVSVFVYKCEIHSPCYQYLSGCNFVWRSQHARSRMWRYSGW